MKCECCNKESEDVRFEGSVEFNICDSCLLRKKEIEYNSELADEQEDIKRDVMQTASKYPNKIKSVTIEWVEDD